MNRRVILFAALALVVILLGWYFLLWSPTKADVDKAAERRDAAETQEQQLQAQLSRLREAQRQEPLRRAQIETLRTAIPDTPNLSQFIFDVNDAATRSGIRFISIAPSEPRAPAGAAAATTTTTRRQGGNTTTTRRDGTTRTTGAPSAAPPAEIAVAFQLSGGYFQILDFMNRLDRLPRLVVTDTINVAADPQGILTVSLTARMFIRSIPAGFEGGVATTSTTAAGGATTTTAAGGATTTSAAGGATTTTAGARP